jgi:hypothetical protein
MANTFKFGNGEWAVGKETALAYNDENSNFKPLPFTFDRASTATVVNKDGLIETVGTDEPRIDFTNNTNGHLLLEPSRTNLITDSAEGNYGNAPASESNTIAPDGTNTAVIPVPDSSSDRYNYSFSGGDYSTNTKLTYSWFRKRISTPTSTAFLGDLRPTNLVNVTQVGSTIQIGSNINGYDRFSATFNVTDGSLSGIIRMYFGSVIGIGNSSIAYWGHQLEEGSYATSYIPTSGSTATRSNEDINLTLPDNASFNSSNGFSLYGELLTNGGNGASPIAISFNTNTSGYFGFGHNSSTWRARINDGTDNELHTSSASILSVGKLALSFNSSGFSMYANGTSFASGNTDLGANTSVDSITFRNNTEEFGSLQIRELKLYNDRLSDSELQALTS